MLECVSYTSVNKSTCQGVATIRVPKWGIKISGISLHVKDDKRWINFPSRIKKNGKETEYYSYISFDKKDHKIKFCEMVKQAIDAYNSIPKNKT